MLTRAARERAGRRFPSRLPPDLVLQFLEPRDLVLQACVSVGWRDAAALVFRQVEARELATTADASYLRRHPDINARMRAIVIDWLIEVDHRYKNPPEMLYLTVNIIDRYLSVAPPVTRGKLQLISVAALGVAAHRFSINVLDEKLSYLCDKAYPPAEVCAMRGTLVSVLGHDITTVSTRYYVMRYLRACADEVSRDLVWHASHVAERMLQEYKMLKHRPSLVAACAVYVARGSLGQAPWTTFLRRCSRISEDDLRPCLEKIKRYMDRPLPNYCKSTDRRFRNTRFGSVASTPLKIGDWSFSSSTYTHQHSWYRSPRLFIDRSEEMSMTGTVWLPDVLIDAGWHVKRSRNTGVLYFANSQTNICQWDRPAEPRPPPDAPPTAPAGDSSSEESESDDE